MLLHKLLNCSECEYTCKGKDNMKLHMLLHDDHSKEFSCSECDYKTTINNDLKTHMLSHKILTCSQCEYTCKEKDNMK